MLRALSSRGDGVKMTTNTPQYPQVHPRYIRRREKSPLRGPQDINDEYGTQRPLFKGKRVRGFKLWRGWRGKEGGCGERTTLESTLGKGGGYSGRVGEAERVQMAVVIEI